MALSIGGAIFNTHLMNPINVCRSACLFFISIFYTASGSNAQSIDAKKIQAATATVIQKAYPACVRLWGFDTVKKVQNSAQFTGVVVSAEGHILTAAHAMRPGKIYMVNFPDGRTVYAEGMGRIAPESQGRPDAAMLKITTKGTWPNVEMGWSSSLKLNSLCVSIAYPTTLAQKLPSIRVGRISRMPDVWGFLTSTCAMEPGDSGGPLFDDQGRVVGIHSRIDVDESINYEIPVDIYRKYWSALNVAEDYKSLPSKADTFGSDPLAALIKPIGALENMGRQVDQTASYLAGNCLMISSRLKGQTQQVFGTVFVPDAKKTNPRFKSGSFIISKSSLVGEDVIVYSTPEQAVKAIVVAREKEKDLVLLYLPIPLKSGIQMKALAANSAIRADATGKFLVSVFPGQRQKVSVLGSTYFDLDKKFSSGFFGASATFIKEQIILTRIAPGSPAAVAGLTLQDQITGINGTPILLPPDYGREVMKYEPGDTISIQGVRAGTPYSLPVILSAMPSPGNHPAEFFAGGKSSRRDGFKEVFTHDALIRPEECGGPVFDLAGKFYGINIARFSRTSCLVISPKMIREFVLKSLPSS